jgi:hypothetical protein
VDVRVENYLVSRCAYVRCDVRTVVPFSEKSTRDALRNARHRLKIDRIHIGSVITMPFGDDEHVTGMDGFDIEERERVSVLVDNVCRDFFLCYLAEEAGGHEFSQCSHFKKASDAFFLELNIAV